MKSNHDEHLAHLTPTDFNSGERTGLDGGWGFRGGGTLSRGRSMIIIQITAAARKIIVVQAAIVMAGSAVMPLAAATVGRCSFRLVLGFHLSISLPVDTTHVRTIPAVLCELCLQELLSTQACQQMFALICRVR